MKCLYLRSLCPSEHGSINGHFTLTIHLHPSNHPTNLWNQQEGCFHFHCVRGYVSPIECIDINMTLQTCRKQSRLFTKKIMGACVVSVCSCVCRHVWKCMHMCVCLCVPAQACAVRSGQSQSSSMALNLIYWGRLCQRTQSLSDGLACKSQESSSLCLPSFGIIGAQGHIQFLTCLWGNKHVTNGAFPLPSFKNLETIFVILRANESHPLILQLSP